MCSTGGNFGQALAYTGRRRGFPVDVFVSANLDVGKLARIRALATDVVVVDGNEERAKEAARERANADAAGRLLIDQRSGEQAEPSRTHMIMS